VQTRRNGQCRSWLPTRGHLGIRAPCVVLPWRAKRGRGSWLYLGRMQLMPRPQPPCPYQSWAIETERCNGGSTGGCAAENPSRIATPAKMIRPMVLARVKERNPVSGAFIRRFGACLLVGVAPEASPAQVRLRAAAAACRGHNMVHGEVMASEVGARSAILAVSSGPPSYAPSEPRGNRAHGRWSSAAARRNRIASHLRRSWRSSRRSGAVRGRCCLAASNCSARACSGGGSR
jgi:hypothetical protein